MVLTVGACSQVYFIQPQPQKGTTIKAFIEEVQGEYSDSLLDIRIGKKEFEVSGEQFELTTKTPVENEALVKFYKDFYFISFADSIYYSVYMLKFYDEKLALFMINADERSLDHLRRIVDVVALDTANEDHLIDPSKKQFEQIVDSGLFEVINVMTKK